MKIDTLLIQTILFLAAFAKLIKSLWKQGAESGLNPTDFKAQLQKYAPRFVGYK